MKEEDIDKIFREVLQDSVQPVSETDWENFVQLQNKRGNSSWKYFILAMILLISFSVVSYWYFSDTPQKSTVQVGAENNGQAEMENADTTNVSVIRKGEEIISENAGVTDYKLLDDSKALTVESNPEGAENKDDFSNLLKNEPLERTNDYSHRESPHSDEDVTGKNDLQIAKDKNVLSKKDLNVKVDHNPDLGRTENKSTSTDDNKNTRPGETGNESRESITESPPQTNIPTNISNVNQAWESGVPYPVFNPVFMNTIPYNTLPVATTENVMDMCEIPASMRLKNHQLSMYVGVEQNNILGVSPMVGILSSWKMDRWSLGVGIGYQRSGALNWNQVSRRTIYGFDKYEGSATLQTRSVDLISMPFIVSRQIGGVSDLFLGITPSILVNAHQELLISDDSNLTNFIPESGYLYKTEAPEIIYFISGGYTHQLTTWWSVDIGVNYTFQEWRTTNKVPVGTFIRTHIRIK